MVQKKYFSTYLFLVTAFFGFSGLTTVYGFDAKLCCVYYADGGPSGQCDAFSLKNPTEEIIPGNKQFQCSAYKDGVVTVDGESFTILQNEGERVADINLRGGYDDKGQTNPMEYANATAENSCVKIDGYTKVLLKDMTKLNKDLCILATDLAKTNGFGTSKIGPQIETLQSNAKKVYSALQSISAATCCVPKKINPETGCFQPKIKPDIEATYNGKFVGKLPEIPQPLMDLKPVTPNLANANDQSWAQFFTCDTGGEWESKYVLSGWSCKAISMQEVDGWAYDIANCQQKKYYCLCRKDGTACEPTAYDKLQTADKAETNTEQKSCAPAMYGKNGGETNEQLQWECVNTERPANQKGSDYCAHLAHPPGQYQEEDFLVPKEVKDLNKIGTLDPKVLLGRFIRAATGIMGSIALAMLVYGGILFMISAGNSERTEKGRHILVWSSLGLIVILTSYALVNLIFTTF